MISIKHIWSTICKNKVFIPTVHFDVNPQTKPKKKKKIQVFLQVKGGIAYRAAISRQCILSSLLQNTLMLTLTDNHRFPI